MTANPHELDPPFRNESPDETNRRAHVLGGGLYGQQPPIRLHTGLVVTPPSPLPKDREAHAWRLSVLPR
jgi:hypothetical protein